MRRLLVPVLLLWAVIASLLAAHFYPRDVPRSRTNADRLRAADHERTRHLSRRVRELEAALAATLDPPGNDAGAGDASGPPLKERIASLLAQERRLIESDRVKTTDLQKVQRQLYALVAHDVEAHLVLMELLKGSTDEDEADEILSYLIENAFSRMVRSRAVTAHLREEARKLLATAPSPHLRSAAARVLYGYDPPRRDDVLFGLERLSVEEDAGVRDELLSEIGARGRGVELTIEEARPLLLGLREQIRAGRAWCAGALAAWSSQPADYDLVQAGLLQEKDPRRVQEYLNAFRADTRLVGGRADESRELLLQVMQDPSLDANARSLALHFLKGYAPWDRATADAVHRYLAGGGKR
ncbi:MAG: hypothetical protein ACYTEZ_14670 [Planctomycetota bacterium]|jgi:hypothetical protein